jgi:hypothetical protein
MRRHHMLRNSRYCNVFVFEWHVKVVVHSYFVLNRRRLCAFVMLDDLLGLSPTVLVDRPSERGATRSDGQPLATGP